MAEKKKDEGGKKKREEEVRDTFYSELDEELMMAHSQGHLHALLEETRAEEEGKEEEGGKKEKIYRVYIPVDYSESVQQSYQRGEVSLEMMAKYFRRDDIVIHCAKTMCQKLEENCKKC